MQVNQEVILRLRDQRINRDAGLLVLLGIYYGLDVDTVCPEDVVKKINLTKIVERDYKTNPPSLQWSVPLFEGEETDFGWVREWCEGFGKRNPERRGDIAAATSRMKQFFARYPDIRKTDVFAARDLHLARTPDPIHVKTSHKFIFEGQGGSKSSLLRSYCDLVKISSTGKSNQVGTVIK